MVALEGRSRCESGAEVKHMECEEGGDLGHGSSKSR